MLTWLKRHVESTKAFPVGDISNTYTIDR